MGDIRLLIQKQDEARLEIRKYVEDHEYFKAKGKGYESEADYQWRTYKTWSQQLHRLGEEIQVKLKAVQKYEKYKWPKKMEEPKRIIGQQDYMKYGPSDDEE